MARWCKRRLYVYMILIFFLTLVTFSMLSSQLPSLVTTSHHQSFANTTEVLRSIDQNNHRLGIIVPFRDRFDQLLEFVPYISSFLAHQKIKHKIYIINQVDELRFNRAYLINIGFIKAKLDLCDYIVMHDVDLLPLNPQLDYSYPKHGVVHLASPELHPKYHYNTFIGGVLIVRNDHFELLNGMSNRYYGWGREDDEFFVRMRLSGVHLYRPFSVNSNKSNSFRHIHSKRRYPRDMNRYFNQTLRTNRRDRRTGLNTTKFEEFASYSLNIDGASCTVYSVGLYCDYTDTPWCIEPKTNRTFTTDMFRNRN